MSACLVAVVGSSGAGKDSLLAHARAMLQNDPQVRFVRRCITRPADAGGEEHEALSDAEFARRRASGDFALHWESHGLGYGIGREIDDWLAQGCMVVYNGSRAHLPVARQDYPQLRVVAVTARPETLVQRLAQRCRESAADIAERIRQQPPLPADLPMVEVGNDADLASASAAFLQALHSHRNLNR